MNRRMHSSFWIAAAVLAGTPAVAADACEGSCDLRLTNGRFACTKVVNLRGRTVVPGLIGNHNHIVLFGMRPGHDSPIEAATSMKDVQAILKVRAKTVPPGAFIKTLGDWNAKQFAEKRAPTLAELECTLDAMAYLVSYGLTTSGDIGTGKPGDLVALTAGYFDPKRVPDEEIKHLKAALRVVDGRVS
jgi:predicted amidohydrolase YtcJ